MNISNQIYTYSDLKKGLDLGLDDYGIAASKCRMPLQKAFANNPNLLDDTLPFAYIVRADGIAVGIAMWFPIKIKAGNDIIDATSGSTLEVYEDFRKYGIGVDIMMFPIMTPGFSFLLYAGISKQALKIYKKMRFSIFEYPRMMRICKTRCIIEKIGIQGVLLTCLSAFCDGILHIGYGLISIFSRSYRKFKILKMDVVPDWVDDIVLNEGHKYMEVHDQKWLQWNLDYNLHNEKDDIQSFYAVYNNEKPIAFFLTKERFRDIAGGELKNVVIGSIMEWGVCKNAGIEEKDIYKMALKTFNNKVDIMEFATVDKSVAKSMKKYGFIQHGFSHIIIKDLLNKYKDSEDISQWRIRFGYADVFLT